MNIFLSRLPDYDTYRDATGAQRPTNMMRTPSWGVYWMGKFDTNAMVAAPWTSNRYYPQRYMPAPNVQPPGPNVIPNAPATPVWWDELSTDKIVHPLEDFHLPQQSKLSETSRSCGKSITIPVTW